MSVRTDYTDPSTIDVDTVLSEINQAFKMRGKNWTKDLSWPNVTVKALADEVTFWREQADDAALNAARVIALQVTLQQIGLGNSRDPERLAREVLKALRLETS